ncbi:protein Vhl [Anastrepha obliqua]|nr:protein Vhl [Anastrepha obliqua]
MALEPLGAQRELWNPGQESFVLFRNRTKRTINLYWSLRGNRNYHVTLGPGDSSKTNTFTNHAWIFCDKDTDEMMCVEQRKIFWPQTYRMRDPRNPSRIIPCRKEINIHFTLRTLRENCIWQLVTKLHAIPHQVAMSTIDDVLLLPKVLKNELRMHFLRKEYPTIVTMKMFNSILEREKLRKINS